ncbi:MAG TPA: hypothetical protein DCM27_00995 [Rhodospirillaceae bacterium]|nr:hypothetical protein [Rhodospirillaceae bacterium]
MAASIALNSSAVDMDVADDTAPKGLRKFAGGLLSRVKKVGENLRNIKMTKEDVVFGAASIGAGLLAKTAAVAALGVASGGSAILLAAAGGAAMGLAKAAVKHGREGKSIGSFFSRTTLMSTVSSTAISVATLGYSGLFECATGQTLTHALGEVFQKAADKLFHLAPFGNAFAAAPDINPDPVPEHLKDVVPPREPAILPDDTQVEFIEEEEGGELDVAPAAAQPVNHMPPAPLKTIAATPEMKADSGSVYEGNKNIDDETRSRALAWAKAMNPAAEIAAKPAVPSVPLTSADKVIGVRDLSASTMAGTDPKNIVLDTGNAGVKVRMPAVPNMDAEIKTANAVIHEAVAAGDAGLNELDPRKLAGACVTDLPSSQAALEAQNGVLPNTCTTAKDDMGAGDYVIVRDAADQPSAKRGLRVLFSTAAEKTTAFIGRVVGSELPDMMTEKLAAAAPAP